MLTDNLLFVVTELERSGAGDDALRRAHDLREQHLLRYTGWERDVAPVGLRNVREEEQPLLSRGRTHKRCDALLRRGVPVNVVRLIDNDLCSRLPPSRDARLHLDTPTLEGDNVWAELKRLKEYEHASQHGNAL
eukprot:2703798-Prymnesium_polylepis.1